MRQAETFWGLAGLGFIPSTAGSLPDPLNLIPFAGGFNRAMPGTKLLSRAGLKMLGRSALIGAGENAAGAAMSDAAAFPMANRWGADLGLERAAEDVAFAGALGSMLSAAGTSIGHMKAAKGELNGPRPAPPDETGRMIKSEHPHGWSGPDRDIVPVEIGTYVTDSPISEGFSPRSVGSLLVYTSDGILDITATRKNVKRDFNSILESWNLEAASLEHNRAGSRKKLPLHEQTGWTAEIGKSDLGEINSAALNEADFLALEKLPELWRTSAYRGTENWQEGKKKGRAKDFYKAVHLFENELKIGSAHYKVDITVKETASGKHYYYHELTKKNPNDIPGGASSQRRGRQALIVSGSSENISQAGGRVNGEASNKN